MQVAITGASGFLGSSISKYLTLHGFQCLNISRKNIKKGIKINDYEETPNAEIIIHLAQSNNRNFVNQQDQNYVDKNLRVTSNIAKKNFRKLIYISSALVYGDQCKEPRNTIEKVNYYDNYSKIKLKSENIILDHKGLVLRLSNLYGPGMSNKNVFSNVINQVKHSNSIKMLNGHSVRDFIWINDVNNVILKVIKSNLNKSIYNIGSGVGTSIEELIKNIQSIYGTNLPVKYHNQDSTISNIVLDIANTTKDLNWEPKTNLREGLYNIMKLNRNFI
tara:strand:+ start:963 stop:1790 length:828 start_codon:yes stop_codon:yes gene_type:complete